MPLATAGPVEVVIRASDIYATTSYLSVFGQQPRWLPELSPDSAERLYGLPRQVTPQIVSGRSGIPSAIRIIEGAASPLTEFTVGGVGVDFYTSDVELSARLAAVRGTVPAPPLTWYEAGHPLTEARAVDPSGTFAVYLPQMDAASRLHPSSFDDADSVLHSELVMTSWFVDRSVREAEREFWSTTLGMRSVLDVEMDSTDMQVLNGLSRPETMSSLQFAADGYPCIIDLLSYPQLDLDSRDPNSGALIAIVVEVSDGHQLKSLTELGTLTSENHSLGSHPVVILFSPSGIRVIVRETH
jgi:hypothetical protein